MQKTFGVFNIVVTNAKTFRPPHWTVVKFCSTFGMYKIYKFRVLHYGDKSKTEYFKPLHPLLHCREVTWLIWIYKFTMVTWTQTEYCKLLQPALHCKEVLWQYSQCTKCKKSNYYIIETNPKLNISDPWIALQRSSVACLPSVGSGCGISSLTNQHLLHQHTVNRT